MSSIKKYKQHKRDEKVRYTVEEKEEVKKKLYFLVAVGFC